MEGPGDGGAGDGRVLVMEGTGDGGSSDGGAW